MRDPLNLNLPVFDGELDEAIAAGATHLIVDLREDPAGSLALNALLRARQQLRKPGQIALVVSARLKAFCQTTGLDRRFLLADDHGQAMSLLHLPPATDKHLTNPQGDKRSDPAFNPGGKRAA